jgi:hypothetical protein
LASKPLVCQWFGLKITETVFSGLASKSVATIFSGLATKPVVMISAGLASKSAATVSGGLASKPTVTVFSGLTSKLVAMGILVEPQNQGGGGFLGLGLKTDSSGLVI